MPVLCSRRILKSCAIAFGSLSAAGGVAQAASCVDPFLIHSEHSTEIGSETVVSGGRLSSNSFVELGAKSKFTGDLVSGGNAVLEFSSKVNGNATVHGALIYRHEALVTGTVTKNVLVPFCEIPEKTEIITGCQNANVDKSHPKTLSPGKYADVKVFPFGKLTLKSGVYNFKSLDLGSKSQLIVALNSSPLEVNVTRFLRFGDYSAVSSASPIDFHSIQFYTGQNHEVVIGRGAQFRGVLTAPHAKISALENTNVQGALYGERVSVGSHSRCERPAPVLVPPIQIPPSGGGKHPNRLPTIHYVVFDQTRRLELIPGDLIRLVGFPKDNVFNQIDVVFSNSQTDTMKLELSEGGKSYPVIGVHTDISFPYRGDSLQEVIVLAGLDTADLKWGISTAPKVPNPQAPTIHDLGPANTTSFFTLSEGIFTISKYPGNKFNVINLRIESRDGDTLQGYLNISGGAVSLNGMSRSMLFKEQGSTVLAFDMSFPVRRQITVTWGAENRTPAQKTVPNAVTEDGTDLHAVYRFTQDHLVKNDLALVLPKNAFTDGQAPVIARLEHNPIGVLSANLYNSIQGPTYAINGNLAVGKSVHLALPIPARAVMQGFNPDSVRLRHYNEAMHSWIEVRPDSVAGGYAYFTADSFSYWNVVVRVAGRVVSSVVNVVVDAGVAAFVATMDAIDGVADAVKTIYDWLVKTACNLIDPITFLQIGTNAVSSVGSTLSIDNSWSAPQGRLDPVINSSFFEPEPLWNSIWGTAGPGGTRIIKDLMECPVNDATSEGKCWDTYKANADLLLADLLLSKTGFSRRFTLVNNQQKPPGYTGTWPAELTLGLPNHSIHDSYRNQTYSTTNLFRFSSELLKSAPVILNLFQKCDAAVSFADEFNHTFGHIKDFAVDLTKGNLTGSCKELLGLPEDLVEWGTQLSGYELLDCGAAAIKTENYYNNHNLGPYWLGKDRDSHIIGPSHFFNVFSVLLWADDGYKNAFRGHANRLRDEIHGYVGFTQDMYQKNNIMINAMAGVGFWDWITKGDKVAFNTMKTWLEAKSGTFGGYAEDTGYLQGEINAEIPYIMAAMVRAGAFTYERATWVGALPPKYLQSGNWQLFRSRILPDQILPPETDDGLVNETNYLPYAFLTTDDRYAAFQKAHPNASTTFGSALKYIGLPFYGSLTDGPMPILGSIVSPEPGNGAGSGDGVGTVRAQSGSDIATLSIVAENGNMRINGLGHDQQDNTSITFDHSRLGRIVIDPGYYGFGNRDANDFARFSSHNVVMSPTLPFGGEAPNGKFTASDLLSAIAAQPGINNVDWLEPLLFSFVNNFNIGPDAHAGGADAFLSQSFQDDLGGYFQPSYGLEVKHTSTSGITNHRAAFYFADHMWIIDRLERKETLWSRLNWGAPPTTLNGPSGPFSEIAAAPLVADPPAVPQAFPQKDGTALSARQITRVSGSSAPMNGYAPVFVTGLPIDGTPSGFTSYDCPIGVCLQRITSTGVEQRVIVPYWSNGGLINTSIVDIPGLGKVSGQIVLATNRPGYGHWEVRVVGEESPGVTGNALGTSTCNVGAAGYYQVEPGGVFVIIPSNGHLEPLCWSGEGPAP